MILAKCCTHCTNPLSCVGVVVKQTAASVPSSDMESCMLFFVVHRPLGHFLATSWCLLCCAYPSLHNFLLLDRVFHFSSPLISSPQSRDTWLVKVNIYLIATPSVSVCLSVSKLTENWRCLGFEIIPVCYLWPSSSLVSACGVPTSFCVSCGWSSWVSGAGKGPLFAHLPSSTIFEEC